MCLDFMAVSPAVIGSATWMLANHPEPRLLQTRRYSLETT
jgi:hypothetical protein